MMFAVGRGLASPVGGLENLWLPYRREACSSAPSPTRDLPVSERPRILTMWAHGWNALWPLAAILLALAAWMPSTRNGAAPD